MRRLVFLCAAMFTLTGCGHAAATTTATSTAVTVSAPPAQYTYKDGVDPRELYKDVAAYAGQPMRYEGTVITIQVTGERTFVQILPDGADAMSVLDFVYFAGTSTQGIVKGSHVAAFGRPLEMFTITNSFGGKVDQPLLSGDYLDIPSS